MNNTEVLAKEMLIGTREVYPYTLCSSCRSLSIQSVPSNLKELYEKYPGLQHSPRKKTPFRNFLKRRYQIGRSCPHVRKFLNLVYPMRNLWLKSISDCNLSTDSQILDVGCGTGGFVYELHELGFKNSFGIDLGLPHDTTLTNGARLYKKEIFDIDQKFDFITLHHCFEHLENPLEALRKIGTLLKEDGMCLLRFPNIESWSSRFFKENWSGIHAPYHLFLPSKKGMEILCKDSGFKIVEIRYEQVVDSLLRSFCYSLDFASSDEFGTKALLKGKPLGRKDIPLFTKKEITFWKARAKKALEDRLSDYIAYYIKKI